MALAALIVQGVTSLASGFFETKKAKQKAEQEYHMSLARGEQDWDLAAMRASEFSWKDEFWTYVLGAPLVMAWFAPEKAILYIGFLEGLPAWYQFMLGGMICASFGLRWYFKNLNPFTYKKAT